MLLLLGAVFITVRTLLSGRWRVPARFPLPPPPPFSALDTLVGEAEGGGFKTLNSVVEEEELLFRRFTSGDAEGGRTSGGHGGKGLGITAGVLLAAAIFIVVIMIFIT